MRLGAAKSGDAQGSRLGGWDLNAALECNSRVWGAALGVLSCPSPMLCSGVCGGFSVSVGHFQAILPLPKEKGAEYSCT